MTTNSSRPELKFNRYDAMIAAVVALLAVAVALWFYLPKAQAGRLTAVITQHGQEMRRVELTPGLDKDLTVELDDGTYHLTVRISGDGVYVSDSDCPTQDCVHTGTIRRAGQSIVCLPAQVVIHLEGAASADAPDVIVG